MKNSGTGDTLQHIPSGARDMLEPARSIASDPFELDDDAAPGALSTRIEHRLCVGRPGQHFLFGGAAMALAARAIERQTGEPPRWLTLQFIAPTLLGERLDLSVERIAGERIAQLDLTGNVDGRTVMRGMAAAGSRDGVATVAAVPMPAIAAPGDCPIVRAHHQAEYDVHQLLDIRLGTGRFGIFSKVPVSADGHVLVWMRPRHGVVDVAALALMADFIPSTTSNALGIRAGGSSLDNTLRIVRIVPTGWVLCDISISAIAEGIGHGTVHLHAEDGTLMAIAGQSFIARAHPGGAVSA